MHEAGKAEPPFAGGLEPLQGQTAYRIEFLVSCY